jgi:hypothetical protein
MTPPTATQTVPTITDIHCCDDVRLGEVRAGTKRCDAAERYHDGGGGRARKHMCEREAARVSVTVKATPLRGRPQAEPLTATAIPRRPASTSEGPVWAQT